MYKMLHFVALVLLSCILRGSLQLIPLHYKHPDTEQTNLFITGKFALDEDLTQNPRRQNLTTGRPVKSADFIHPCSELSDECFTKATLDALPGIVKGIPEAGIPSLDPLHLDRDISMNLPGNLKMTFHNGKLIGLSTCIPDKVSSRREKRTFVFELHCNFTIRGHYSLQGRLLLFNLDTDGSAKIKIWNQRIRLDVLEKVVKNEKGEGHYKINSYKYKADYGTDLKMNLTNLFRGSPEISANILQVLNSNSQLVAQEFGGPILDFAIDYAMNVTQKFFDAYTYDQLTHIPLTEEFFEKQ